MQHLRSRRQWLLSVLPAIVVLLCSSAAVNAQTSAYALGSIGTTWGGEHVRLQVTTDGATLDFDCASGTITKPLQVDAQGNFKTTGMFTRERGGPVMRDGNQAAAAVYSGSIQNGTMKLTVTSGPQSESQGDYVLVQGKPGHVVKCR